jgi:hypothetical protein
MKKLWPSLSKTRKRKARKRELGEEEEGEEEEGDEDDEEDKNNGTLGPKWNALEDHFLCDAWKAPIKQAEHIGRGSRHSLTSARSMTLTTS